MQCPKCSYVRSLNESAPDYECPKCGVVYAKFVKKPLPNIEKDAPSQAQAGVTKAKSQSHLPALLGGLVILFMVWYFFGGGLQRQANDNLRQVYDTVANDAVIQYGISSRNGSPIDICVQAGLVTAAYLQAKDEANYQTWRQRQRKDCETAGVPH